MPHPDDRSGNLPSSPADKDERAELAEWLDTVAPLSQDCEIPCGSPEAPTCICEGRYKRIAAFLRGAVPECGRALPDKRYARITIRNPNLMRLAKIEINGEDVELEAGESTDLCLTDHDTSAEAAIREHNHGCDTACEAQRATNDTRGCGYQKPDGTLVYPHRRCPECPIYWKIEWPTAAAPIPSNPQNGGQDNAAPQMPQAARPGERPITSSPAAAAPTPRTDAITTNMPMPQECSYAYLRMLDLARQLERELAVSEAAGKEMEIVNTEAFDRIRALEKKLASSHVGRNDVLEEAAKECEKQARRIGDSDSYWGPEYAKRIRALKAFPPSEGDWKQRGMSSRSVAEWAIEQAKLPGTWEEKVAAVLAPSGERASRSQLRRIAAQKGEPAPDFSASSSETRELSPGLVEAEMTADGKINWNPEAPSSTTRGTPRTDEVTLGEWEYGRDEDGNWQIAKLDYEVLRDRSREIERDLSIINESLVNARAALSEQSREIINLRVAARSSIAPMTVETFDGEEPAIAVAASWIVREHDGTKDYACKECVPDGTALIEGFQCYYHRALAQSAIGRNDG